MRYHESSRYLLFQPNNGITSDKKLNRFIGIFDKQTGLVNYSEDMTIKNDIDGGVNFSLFTWFRWSCNDVDKLYCVINPYELLDHEIGKFEDVKSNEKLQQLISELSEDQNPILMVVTLKKSKKETNTIIY